MKKIILTGGGTAGHVTPNIALIPELKKRGYEIYYIGSKNGIEKQLIEEEKIKYFPFLFFVVLSEPHLPHFIAPPTPDINILLCLHLYLIYLYSDHYYY